MLATCIFDCTLECTNVVLFDYSVLMYVGNVFCTTIVSLAYLSKVILYASYLYF